MVIPGARNPRQAVGNAEAAGLAPLGDDVHAKIEAVYDELIRPHVRDRW